MRISDWSSDVCSSDLIEAAGYSAQIADGAAAAASHEAEKTNEVRRLRRDVVIAALLTLPLFVLEMGAHFFPSLHHWLMTVASNTSLTLFYFVLASGVLFGPGRRFPANGVASGGERGCTDG